MQADRTQMALQLTYRSVVRLLSCKDTFNPLQVLCKPLVFTESVSSQKLIC